MGADTSAGSPAASLATSAIPATGASLDMSPPPLLASPPPQDIARLLTIVLTTSPTPSAPATGLVAAVLASFRAHCPALLACPVIVVFDTYDHVGAQLRLKKGCVTPVEAAHYDAYKANVKALVRETWAGETAEKTDDKTGDVVEEGTAEYGSPFLVDNTVPFTITRTAGGRVTFVEPAMRLGFGLGVRTAVRAATTPYVWVQQHDWTLAADIPLAAMLDAMRTSEQAVGEDDREEREGEGDDGEDGEDGEDGKDAAQKTEADMEEAITLGEPSTASSLETSTSGLPSALDPRVPVAIRYICLPSVRMLRYAGSAHAVGFPTLRALTMAFRRDVPTSSSPSPSSTVSPDLPQSGSNHADAVTSCAHPVRLPLTPLFFWHDKTHIASRAHYLRRVFPSRLSLGRGDFIEDHIGQRARDQMKRDAAAWRRWACWLYYPAQGNQLCLRHLQGRTWRGEEQEQVIRDRHVARNRSAASAAAAAAAALAVEAAVAAANTKRTKGGQNAVVDADDGYENGLSEHRQRRRSSAARHEMGWAAMPFEASDGEE
ncbi:MAG: hypothetical protein STHCBS139747_001081 [Sporothrix thermara]